MTIQGKILTVTLVLLVAAILAIPVAASKAYHGNVQRMIYHKPGCRHYNCKACTKVFRSKDEAQKAGYRACKVCNV